MAASEAEPGYYAGDIDAIDTVVNIDITCAACERLIYRKECRGNTLTWRGNPQELK